MLGAAAAAAAEKVEKVEKVGSGSAVGDGVGRTR